MPNVRDENKRLIGAWFTTEEIEELDKLARRFNTNRSEVLRRLVWIFNHPLGEDPK